jgi:ACS family sodium-dependent inorganic phosphate cotransporter-like MFS transporter 5
LLCSFRLALAFIALVGFIIVYAQRVGMSIAIVCMVNHTAVKMLSNDTLAPNTTREFACQRIANIANASDAQVSIP